MSGDPVGLEGLRATEVVYSAGFGLKDEAELPLRLPAFILPALQAMEALQRLEHPVPRLLLYQATEFIIWANGLPTGCGTRTASRMERYLRAYVETLHPSVAGRVSYHFDLRFSDQEKDLCQRLVPAVQDVLERSSQAEGKMALERSEKRHSRRQGQALLYAAANAYYSGAVPGHYPFADALRREGSSSEATYLVLPIGGQAEKLFFGVSRLLREKLLTCGDDPVDEVVGIFPRVTELGKKPTYYMVRAEGKVEDPVNMSQMETYLAAFRSTDGRKKSIVPDVARDLDALERDGFSGQVAEAILGRAGWAL